MTRFDEIMREVKRRNLAEHQLDEIEKLVFNRNIKDNPVLRRMKKEDWIVDVYNKHILRWACKYTLDIVRACYFPETLDIPHKKKDSGGAK